MAVNWRSPLALTLLLMLVSCATEVPSVTAVWSNAGAGFVRVSWEPAPGALGYVVSRYDVDAGRGVELARLSAEAFAWTDLAAPVGASLRYSVAAFGATGRAGSPRSQGNPPVVAGPGVAVGDAPEVVDGVAARVYNEAGFALPDAEVVWWVEAGAAVVVWRGVSDEFGVAHLRPTSEGTEAWGGMEGYLWVVPLGGSGGAGQLRRVQAAVGEILELDPRDPSLVGVDVRITRRGEPSNHFLQVGIPVAGGSRVGPAFNVTELASHLRLEPATYDGVITGFRYPEERAAVLPVQVDARHDAQLLLDTAEQATVATRVEAGFVRADRVVSLFSCWELIGPISYASRACPGDPVVELPAGRYVARAIVRTREGPVDWIFTLARPGLSVSGTEALWRVGEGVTLQLAAAATTVAGGTWEVAYQAADAAGNSLELVERREAGTTVMSEVVISLLDPGGALLLQRRLPWRPQAPIPLPIPADAPPGRYRLEVVASVGPLSASPLRVIRTVEVAGAAPASPRE